MEQQDKLWSVDSFGLSTLHDIDEPPEPTPPRHPFLSQKEIRFSDTQLNAFHERLDALIKNVTMLAQENDARDDPLYESTVVFYKK